MQVEVIFDLHCFFILSYRRFQHGVKSLLTKFIERNRTMNISIKITNASEAEELSQIQKAAFKPLYEKFHDAGNPFLRGPEDILRRLNKLNRHFTILLDGKLLAVSSIACMENEALMMRSASTNTTLREFTFTRIIKIKESREKLFCSAKKNLLTQNSIMWIFRRSWRRIEDVIRAQGTVTQENESRWRALQLWQCSKRQ